MKTKKLKGFTLIECLIAMAILGITSLLIVQSYTQLMKITRMNDTISTSIAKQMADAEAKADGNAKPISGATISSDAYDPNEGREFKMIKSGTTQTYVTNVNVYCVRPYQDGTQLPDGTTGDDGTDIRYIYFHR